MELDFDSRGRDPKRKEVIPLPDFCNHAMNRILDTIEKDSGRRAGFSLLEIVVASAVTLVLAAVMISLLSAATSTWQRLHSSVSTEGDSRRILDQIVADLESAFFRPDGAKWFVVSVLSEGSGLATTFLEERSWLVDEGAPPSHTVSFKPDHLESLMLGEPRIEDLRFGQSGSWLRFFTTKIGSNDRGASTPDESDPDYDDKIADELKAVSSLTAVSYQIVRRNVAGSPSSDPEVNSAAARYLFYRSSVRVTSGRTDSTGQAQGAFEVGFDLEEPEYNAPSAGIGSPGSISKAPPSQLLGNNVIDFGVRLFDVVDRDLIPLFPMRADGSAVDHFSDGYFRGYVAEYPFGSTSGPFPKIIEVMVRILTEQGAREIENLEAGRVEGDWWEIAEANSKVHTRRVDVKIRPF